jgi:hypothetical protein
MRRIDWKKYMFYLVRWQLSTPILAGALLVLSTTDKLTATVIANLLGGLIFFWVDMFIFSNGRPAVQWEVKDRVMCVDCGREARGYRIARAGKYDRLEDAEPEFRCETCSGRKTEELRLKGVAV